MIGQYLRIWSVHNRRNRSGVGACATSVRSEMSLGLAKGAVQIVEGEQKRHLSILNGRSRYDVRRVTRCLALVQEVAGLPEIVAVPYIIDGKCAKGQVISLSARCAAANGCAPL